MMRSLDSLRIQYVPGCRWPVADNASSFSWLGADERAELGRLSDWRRRRQWLAGRWTSKLLIRREIDGFSNDGRCDVGEHDDFSEIQISTRDARGRGRRPFITIGGRELPWSLSISHSERGVLVALAATDQCSLGVDLASKAAHDAGFLRLWFTPGERCWIEADPSRRAAVLWAMKEATYKAYQSGEGWSPRKIEVRPLLHNRFACFFRDRLLRSLWTDVLDIDDQIAAVVCLPRTPESRGAGCQRDSVIGAAASPRQAWSRIEPPMQSAYFVSTFHHTDAP
jgi:hypothetical protein